jgi:hypothetical protein
MNTNENGIERLIEVEEYLSLRGVSKAHYSGRIAGVGFHRSKRHGARPYLYF